LSLPIPEQRLPEKTSLISFPAPGCPLIPVDVTRGSGTAIDSASFPPSVFRFPLRLVEKFPTPPDPGKRRFFLVYGPHEQGHIVPFESRLFPQKQLYRPASPFFHQFDDHRVQFMPTRLSPFNRVRHADSNMGLLAGPPCSVGVCMSTLIPETFEYTGVTQSFTIRMSLCPTTSGAMRASPMCNLYSVFHRYAFCFSVSIRNKSISLSVSPLPVYDSFRDCLIIVRCG